MSVEIKNKFIKKLKMILCIVCFAILQVLIVISSRFGFSAFNGVILACQFAFCLLITKVDLKRGLLVSTALLSISIVAMLQQMLMGNVIGPLPGLFNTIIYLIVLLILNKHLKQRETDAVTDFLTGLMNRRGLQQMIVEKLEDDEEFYIIYLDLYNFSIINDNYGHSQGDKVLREIGAKLKSIVGKFGVVSRMAGDEYVIIVNKDRDPEAIANEALEMVREKIVLYSGGEKKEIYMSAYAGIAACPEHSKDPEEIIVFADIAMAKATKDKSQVPVFFNPSMPESVARKLEVEKYIREGLAHNYFYNVYQPQYRVKDQGLRGFESLLRLKTASGELISPSEFIPVAESCGLIGEIDDYVLVRVMKEFKEMVVYVQENLIISVNISAKSLCNPMFSEKISSIIMQTGFPARNLEIEITEYSLVHSFDVAIENIKRLRSLGVKVALDDFGTGYTSLSYLYKMPVNLLKIDKTLIDDIENDAKSRLFVNAVISMGHLMNCEVISEGVENTNQVSILESQNCDFIQGFVWSKPLEYEDARKMAMKTDIIRQFKVARDII